MAAPGAPDAQDGRRLRLRAGGRRFAAPLRQVRCVLAAPRLARAPVLVPGLLGALAMDATAVPVFDLAALAGEATGGEPLRRIVVVTHQGALVGLGVDAVETLGAGEPEDEPLDLAARLPKPFERREVPPRPAPPRARLAAAAPPLVSFEVEGRLYALPMARLRGVAIAAGERDGLSAIAAGALLGRGGETGAGHAIAVEHGGGVTALRVRQVGPVLRPAADRLDPAPAALRGGAAEAIVRLDDGRLAALLDPDRLLAEAPAAQPASAPAGTGRGERLVRFHIGGRAFAIGAGAVEAITPFPQRLTRPPGASPGLLSAVQRRGEATPVFAFDAGRSWLLVLDLDGVRLALALAARPDRLDAAGMATAAAEPSALTAEAKLADGRTLRLLQPGAQVDARALVRTFAQAAAP